MILMRENPFRGPLEGVGPKNQDFFGPEMATSKVSAIWAQNSQGGPTPSICASNGFSHVKTIKSNCHIKTGTSVILCT